MTRGCRRAQAVVRLNAPQYDAEAFRAGGIAVADLPFPDGAVPPADVVGKCVRPSPHLRRRAVQLSSDRRRG